MFIRASRGFVVSGLGFYQGFIKGVGVLGFTVLSGLYGGFGV